MKKILITEDDTLMAEIYRDNFESEGFAAEIAADGAIALQRLKENPPDLVLLDLMMPGVNGVEVLKHIRSNESTRALPVIVMSNAFASTLGKEAANAGANKCLAKNTCGPKKLVEEVRNVLASAGTVTATAPSTPMVAPAAVSTNAPAAPAPAAPAPAAVAPFNPFAPAAPRPAVPTAAPVPATVPFAPAAVPFAPAVAVAAAPAAPAPAKVPFTPAPASVPFAPRTSAPPASAPAATPSPAAIPFSPAPVAASAAPVAPPAAAPATIPFRPAAPVTPTAVPAAPAATAAPAAPAAASAASPGTNPPFALPSLSPANGISKPLADLRRDLAAKMPEQLQSLRQMMQNLGKADENSRPALLLDYYKAVHQLAGSVSFAGLSNMAQLACALETLLKEIHSKPKKLNQSSLRTIAQAIDVLAQISERTGTQQDEILSSPLILVVDDEPISREMTCSALEQARLRALNLDDPMLALRLAEENRFDLIFMDIQMPGMNGFDVCTRLHSTGANTKTPVVFVTSLNDFDTRAKSTLSGGIDLIAKPILMIELAVKALTHLLRNRDK